MNHSPSLRDAAREEPRLQAGLVCIDLDKTLLLDGTAPLMSDDELRFAPLNSEVMILIEQARHQGIPVVMVTRNNQMQIERVFRLRPDIQALFDDALACDGIKKSSAIEGYRAQHNIRDERVIFLDDTDGERTDVATIENALVGDPKDVDGVKIEKAERGSATVVSLAARRKIAEALKRASPRERQRIHDVLRGRSEPTEADEVLLAA